MLKAFDKENLTVRGIARRISNAGTGPVMAGTPVEIADEMEAWYSAGAADGFNLMFPLLPDDWLNFAQLVVPELQRRGLTRKRVCRRDVTRPSRPAQTGKPLQRQIVLSAPSVGRRGLPQRAVLTNAENRCARYP